MEKDLLPWFDKIIFYLDLIKGSFTFTWLKPEEYNHLHYILQIVLLCQCVSDQELTTMHSGQAQKQHHTYKEAFTLIAMCPETENIAGTHFLESSQLHCHTGGDIFGSLESLPFEWQLETEEPEKKNLVAPCHKNKGIRGILLGSHIMNVS